MTHLFGLTGGIASGKSTVAAWLRTAGVALVDADEVAREVVAPGTAGLRLVVEAFGPDVLTPGGALDRKRLASIVFANAKARETLSAITHPLIAERTAERVRELASRAEPLVGYEAALLVEIGAADAYRPLVVCACPEPIQVARLRVRDGLTESEAWARVRSQKPLAEKVAAADHVIDTNATRHIAERRTREVLMAICTHFGIDPARYGAPS